MDVFWRGAFVPLHKHRDYCGDITQHIYLVERSVETTGPEGALVHMASVTMMFLAYHGIGNQEEPDGEQYVFEFEVEDPSEIEDDDLCKQKIAEQVVPNT